jgi:hypothetical protein
MEKIGSQESLVDMTTELAKAWKIIESERERDIIQQRVIEELTQRCNNPRVATPPPAAVEHPSNAKTTDVGFQIAQMESVRHLTSVCYTIA